jgi:integrase
VELLVLTGIRHGTEAMGLEWRHCAWYHDRQGTQFLRVRVAGKTGERLLIAKHEAVAVLERRAGNDWACVGKTLDQVLNAKTARRIFRFSSDVQPHDFGPVFRRVLNSAGLLKDSADQVRTLYSLRHTYATQELTAGTDIHTLARQMGTSVVMLERHYSKLTASMAADRLAG